jgi:hypothetical protein
LLVLQVVKQPGKSFGLLAKVLDNNARARNNLAGVALSIELAETSPLTEILVGGDVQEADVLLSGKSLDELLVSSLSAVLGQENKAALQTDRERERERERER